MVELSPFDEILDNFRQGRMVILVDDASRENEGDLIVATDALKTEQAAFIMKYARGLMCVSIPSQVAERLNLPLQVLNNQSPFSTPFTISVDHSSVIPNGVTADGRTTTMKRLMDPTSKAHDFISPGHVFPLIAHPAGVLGRQGQTEGSYDLARIAGFSPSGVLCEILASSGRAAADGELMQFAKTHGISVTSVAEIIRYRMRQEVLVREVARATLQTDFGIFETVVFEDDADRKEHLALIYGGDMLKQTPNVLTRIHSECLTGDVFGSRRCDCGSQLALAMQQIVKRGCGVVLYLRQEGRGIGLINKLRAYELQDKGHDTVEANVRLGFDADARDFAVAARMLQALNISDIELLTNNPKKVETLKRLGVTVHKRLPLVTEPDSYSEHYLDTKREKLGHWL